MTFLGYSKRETNKVKGFAILCIVLHNYFHWLWPSPGENEFDFLASRATNFFNLLGQRPDEFVNILFSYLGHYGVQLFIFISGFGLAVSMMQHPRSWESFVVHRLKKLYPLLLTAIVAYILVVLLTENRMLGTYEKQELRYKLLLVHTLIPNSGLSVNGPWWFFGLIFYLYLLFPLLFRWINKWEGWAFFVICLVSYGLVFLFRYGLNLHRGSIVMMNPPGHLPEFCLGILLACSQGKRLHPLWLVMALAVFCLGNYFAFFYPFTFLSVAVLMVFATQWLKSLTFHLSPLTSHLSPLTSLGALSMALFAVHGFLRTPVLKWANTLTGGWAHFGSAMLYLLLSLGVAIAAKALYDGLESLLEKISIRESRITRVLGWVFKVFFILFFVYATGYFVAQNLKTDDTHLETLQIKTDSTSFAANSEYIGLASATLDQNLSAFTIQGSFDYSSLDAETPLPVLVVDIPGVLWRKFTIPEDYRSAQQKQFVFSYRHLNHFLKNLKGKTVNIYLWNTSHTSGRVNRVDISIKK